MGVKDAIPYIALDKKKGKVIVEVRAGTTTKNFPPTPEGAKEIAKLLIKCEAEELLHSSSLDHYDEYGLEFDVLEAVGQEWNKLHPVKALFWWVFVATPAGELIKFGGDGDSINHEADTIFPYGREESAVKQAKCLAKHPSHKDDRIYIVTVFANGQLKHEEWEA